MPKYEVDVGGKTYEVDAPDSNTAWQWANYTHTQAAPPKESTIGSELIRGGKQLVSSTRSGIGSIFNPEEAAKAGVARSEAIGKEAGEGVGFEPVKKAYQEKGLLSAAGEAVSQIPRALAGQGANLATMAGGARLGAMAGSAIAPGVGTVIGGALGAGATLLPQFMGSNVERQAAEQMDEGKDVKIDRTKAYTAAAGQAALEGAGTAFTLGKRVVKGVLGIADDAVLATAKSQAELVKAAERSLAASAGRGAVRGAAEIPVEVSQQILERYQAGLSLTSPEAYKEYGESAYQAALIGGPLGAAGNVVGRGQARGQLEAQQQAQARAQAEQERDVNRGAQLPEDAPVGTQGTMFTDEEMGKRVPTPKEAPEPKSAAVQQGTQLDLGLDFQRDYANLVKERETLRQQPQTPEVKARVADLTDQIMSLHENEVASLRAEKQTDAEARARFPAIAGAPEPAQQSLFPETEALRPEVAEPRLVTPPRTQQQVEARRRLDEADAQAAAEQAQKEQERRGGQYRLPLRNVPEGKDVKRDLTIPARPTEITQQDLEDIGVPMRTSQKWMEQNVLGKTPAEIQVLVGNNPDLLLGTGSRAQILKYLTAPVPEGYKEAPRVTPITQKNQPKPIAQPRGGKPSVEIFGEPTSPELLRPKPQVPTPARASAAPIGLGLAPAGQLAGKGVNAEGTARPALNAPTTTPAVTTSATPAAPVARPPVAAKPAPKAAPAKTVETPAPVSTAETVEEETARKAEAEDVKRRLEEVERKLQARPAPRAETPAPKVEKPAAKEIPEKLREPVGTSEFGMEEGEKEILRGPQGMLFPMSKREEIEYAERKQPKAEETSEEKTTAKDKRQAELDLQPRKEIPEWAAKTAQSGRRAGEVLYATDDIALIRYASVRTGTPIYGAAHKKLGSSYITPDSADKYTNPTNTFTDAELKTVRDEQKKAMDEDAKLALQYPDGPFTGATSNIVAGGSVDSRYTNYLKELTKSLGLGDVRIFLYHSKDVAAPNAVEDLHLHGDFYTPMARANPTDGQLGATVPFGKTNKDFILFVKEGMSEQETLEVMSHELGHIIDKVAFRNAPAATRTAIMDEYDAWLTSLKGKKLADLVMSLRNRAMAEGMETKGIDDIEISKMSALDRQYWMGFNEWFADNVSRWATTADKPLTITEKFFSKVAQMMRDLVAIVTGRKFPPAKAVADFLEAMGPGSADMWLQKPSAVKGAVQPLQNAVSYTTESLIDSMGPLSVPDKSALTKMVNTVRSEPDIDYTTKFRTQVADIGATIEKRLSEKFDGAVRDSLGKLNPMGLYRQAQDYTKMLLEYFQTGTLYKDPTTGLWMSGQGKGVRPPADVYALIDKYADKNGYSRDRATQIASRVLEGVRLDAMRTSNKTNGTNFLIHLKDNEIDQLVKEYNADPDLKEMSKLMDEARIAMVNNMVKAGRLSKEEGKAWSEVAGYVPFDRLEDFSTNFNKIKKVSGKGLAQVGKLPELVGSLNRPVGNVFDNYINTLGWMVGQTEDRCHRHYASQFGRYWTG